MKNKKRINLYILRKSNVDLCNRNIVYPVRVIPITNRDIGNAKSVCVIYLL